MMTNVMAGAYPNLFKAASLYSGVPFACFAGPNSWNSQCADGDLIQTPQQWVTHYVNIPKARLNFPHRDNWYSMHTPDTLVLVPR